MPDRRCDVDERDWLAERFEEHRPRLRTIAYRMLGSVADSDDAVQETWLRLTRSDVAAVQNLGAFLTTIVARVSLDALRTRRARPEDAAGAWLPEPVVTLAAGPDPEHEALVADGVGIALLIVLETLTPAERLAFVLHDMFAVPFDEIATVVGRSPAAARQLASRARRRVQGAAPVVDGDLAAQRRVVDAFLAASRAGDFEALLEVLDPDVVFRIDTGPHGDRPPVVGARPVAERILARGSRLAPHARPAIVNGNAGVIVVPGNVPVAVVGFAVAEGRIVEIDLIADPAKLANVGLFGLA
jgi:RNA polymerase sigma-70 factor (ECF subfamily)